MDKPRNSRLPEEQFVKQQRGRNTPRLPSATPRSGSRSCTPLPANSERVVCVLSTDFLFLGGRKKVTKFVSDVIATASARHESFDETSWDDHNRCSEAADWMSNESSSSFPLHRPPPSSMLSLVRLKTTNDSIHMWFSTRSPPS